jgi:hypothetical protein
MRPGAIYPPVDGCGLAAVAWICRADLARQFGDEVDLPRMGSTKSPQRRSTCVYTTNCARTICINIQCRKQINREFRRIARGLGRMGARVMLHPVLTSSRALSEDACDDAISAVYTSRVARKNLRSGGEDCAPLRPEVIMSPEIVPPGNSHARVACLPMGGSL